MNTLATAEITADESVVLKSVYCLLRVLGDNWFSCTSTLWNQTEILRESAAGRQHLEGISRRLDAAIAAAKQNRANAERLLALLVCDVEKMVAEVTRGRFAKVYFFPKNGVPYLMNP
jgi:hypothetical protein